MPSSKEQDREGASKAFMGETFLGIGLTFGQKCWENTDPREDGRTDRKEIQEEVMNDSVLS